MVHPNNVYRPKAEEIQRTSRAIVQVLAEHGLSSCLFGSTAAAIYGAENRNPRVWQSSILYNPIPFPLTFNYDEIVFNVLTPGR